MKEADTAKVTLGQYLASIRTDRKMTLRQVEEGTGKDVSNAYLSQLENGHIKEPSPHILYSLAELYGVDYASLMEMAGYLTPSKSRTDAQRHGRVATFAEHNLNAEEEAELMRYLQFIRSRKPHGDKS
ncbi:MAG: helix-turn-helix transcriptional regulator [Formivibrio sp.]|nr:helix-turn-helix transcriptional regulator [Formivibrio sp.]